MPESLASITAKSSSPELATRLLESIVESNTIRWIDLLAHSEVFLRSLAELLVVSPPMADLLRRHPEWIARLAEDSEKSAEGSDVKSRDYSADWRAEVLAQSGNYTNLDLLRSFKARELLRIALEDVSGRMPFSCVIARLSHLADFVIGEALRQCWNQVREKDRKFLNRQDTPEGFAIAGFGKLGALELNYSSDVDLVFMCESSEDPQDLVFFAHLGERLISALGQPGADGFLYRVDMRLRPFGQTGALVPTLLSLMTYYESWGEAWERQALIKARYVVGEESIGRRFQEFVDHFAYARQMDDSALEEIKSLKYRSEKEYATESGQVHIKQGEGGIRDIEFYVQFLQLVAGYRHPAVRVRATTDAISQLASARVLLDTEESVLTLAYQFLRIVEHRLQLHSLTPSALVPVQRQELHCFAVALGFGGKNTDPAAEFQTTLDLYRKRVRGIFERIYLTPGYLHLTETEGELASLLSDRAPRARAAALIKSHAFQDTDRAWQNLRLMALGPAGRILPPGERRVFLNFASKLLEVMRESIDPDLALHHLESFSAASGNRISFLRALASQPNHLLRLSNLLALSGLCQGILIRHPEYFDTLASGEFLESGRSTADMAEDLREKLQAALEYSEPEQVLRRFRQRETLRIAYRDLAGLATARDISQELSGLACACVHNTVRNCKHGGMEEVELQVISLGKLGSNQMHYASDLDLIFLYSDPPRLSDAAARAEVQLRLDDWIENILCLLGGVTSEGVVYHVDLRLRPEGASGLLARSFSSMKEYASRFMQPWERMALVRSRPIYGRFSENGSWQAFLAEAVYGFDWDSAAREGIRHLKRRIENERSQETRTQIDFKYGKGGVADLEFLVQFLQVSFGGKFQEVRVPCTLDAIPALGRAGALSPVEVEGLLEAALFQRKVENHYQLMEEWVSREISRESPRLLRLARSLDFSTNSSQNARRQFLDAWDSHAGFVRRLIDQHFYGN